MIRQDGGFDSGESDDERILRKVSDRKVNFPPSLRKRSFLIFEPEATEKMRDDEIHVYPEQHPPELHGTLSGEVRRGLMTTDGQLTLPADVLEKATFESGDTVELVPGNNQVIIREAEDEDDDADDDTDSNQS